MELRARMGAAVAVLFKKPLKLVFPIDPKMERAHPNLPQYAAGDPSFRVDLTCDASTKPA